MRILCCSPDHALRRLLAQMLRVRGEQVTEAYDPSDACSYLRHAVHRPEVALLDARGAPRRALEGLGQLRSIQPGLPAVLLLAERDLRSREAAHAAGALALALPVRPRALRHAIRGVAAFPLRPLAEVA